MSQRQDPDDQKFWIPRTPLQFIFLAIVGVAFLIALISTVSTKLAH